MEGITGLLIGLLLIIFNNKFSHIIIEQQNKFWGFHFGENQIKASRVVCFLVGMSFMIVGFLAVAKIINFR